MMKSKSKRKNMKRINEIGVSIIKDMEHRAGNAKLTQMLYKINDIIYPAQTKYALPEIVKETLSQLTALGMECKEIHCSERYQPKKNEILKCLRERCLALKNYLSNYDADEKEEKIAIDKTIRYQLSVSIKTKEDYKSHKNGIDTLLRQLDCNRKVYQMFAKKISTYAINNKQFERVQDELIDIIACEYSISKAA